MGSWRRVAAQLRQALYKTCERCFSIQYTKYYNLQTPTVESANASMPPTCGTTRQKGAASASVREASEKPPPRAPAFRAPSRPLWRHINRLERVGFVQKDPCISKLGQAAIHVVPLALLRSAVVDANSTQNPRRVAQLSRGTHARLAQCIRAEALQKGLFRLRRRARVRSSSAPVLRDLPYIRLLAFVLVPRRLVGSIGEE